jgi:hypothetical protein
MTSSISLASKRLGESSLLKRFPGAKVLDVTSKGPEPWVRFSPFFPHGGIPVPFSDGVTGASVEGIWQGLKVFETIDVDVSKFAVTSMKGLKRTTRSLGRVLGHRKGIEGAELLPYLEARRLIYLPCYKWVLDHKLCGELQQMRELLAMQPVVLLDYESNADVSNLKSPLSHAALVKAYLEDAWPT